ncbi:MAG TPA: DNA polymerase III subunit epsilon [Bacteroidales bacterium]|nr:DNA polymerase III subunit epsilon [Bacteroidales bacterium]
MKQDKPIVFFDLETTGLNITTDRIVELSYIIVYPDGTEERNTQRFNPTIPIPPSTTAVHHITDDDVRDCPTFKEKAEQIAQVFTDCYIAGYNSDHFDLPLLAEEFIRAGIDINLKNNKTIDVQTIFFKKEPRNLKAAYKFYCDKNLVDAHSANGDTQATYEIFQAQLLRYQDLPADISKLSNYTTVKRNADFAGHLIYNDNNIIVFNFGKHKGKAVTEILDKEPSYYDWVMRSEFPAFTKKILTEIRDTHNIEKLKDKYKK